MSLLAIENDELPFLRMLLFSYFHVSIMVLISD